MSAVLLAAALTACAAPPAPRAGEAFEAGVEVLRAHYFGPSTVKLEPLVQSARAAPKARCDPAPTSCTLLNDYEALGNVTGALLDRHTGTVTPTQLRQSQQLAETGRRPVPSYGLSLLHSGREQALVRDVTVGGPAERAGLQPGDRLTHLNGAEFPRPDEGLRRTGVFGDPPHLTVRVDRGRVGAAQSRTITLDPRPLRPLDLPVLYTPPDAPSGVQVLRIPSFMETRRVGPRVHALVRQAQRQGTQALILDLRGGGGGSAAECLMAAGAFVGPAQVAYASRRGTFVMAWTGRGLQWQDDPAFRAQRWTPPPRPYLLALPARWQGRSAVLVDPATASCHEAMAFLLQRAGVPILGLPTSGLLSSSTRRLDLPGGGALQLSVYRVLDRAGRPLPDRVTPDHRVVDDPLAFAATGEDAMLSAAYRLLAGPSSEQEACSPHSSLSAGAASKVPFCSAAAAATPRSSAVYSFPSRP